MQERDMVMLKGFRKIDNDCYIVSVVCINDYENDPAKKLKKNKYIRADVVS